MSQFPPHGQPQPVEYQPANPDNGPMALILAIISGVIGLAGCGAWIIPLCGCPVAVAGLVCGGIALKKLPNNDQRGLVKILAIIGLVLCGISMLATIINAAWGAYLGATGQHPLIKP